MIKIKLHEYNIHRNETTFRPLVFIRDQLKEVGIELVLDAPSYDFVLVGQASFLDKKLPLQESVEWGLKKISSITGDYILLDGQDAPTLIGSADILRHIYKDKRCKLFLKTSYLKDFDLYKKKWNLGRMYWGAATNKESGYSVPDIDDMKHKMKLAGFNWLSTIQPHWNLPIRWKDKYYDISAMFQFPMHKKVYEHEILQSKFYDDFRRPLMEKLDKLAEKYKIARLKNGVRIPQEEYYEKMSDSKIVIAPLGYGEMAPRDIESSMFGSVLLKNDMSHLHTIPYVYYDMETYVAVKWDWSDLEEKVEQVLSNYQYFFNKMATKLQEKYTIENDATKRVLYWYNLLKDLDNIGVENE